MLKAKLQIPVYEMKDGESIYGFTKTFTASVVPQRNGVNVTLHKVTLKRVTQRYNWYKADLPCNYNTLDNDTLQKMLNDTSYGKLYVSLVGSKILEKIGE